jgi:hypothetical protein
VIRSEDRVEGDNTMADDPVPASFEALDEAYEAIRTNAEPWVKPLPVFPTLDAETRERRAQAQRHLTARPRRVLD